MCVLSHLNKDYLLTYLLTYVSKVKFENKTGTAIRGSN